MVIKAKLVAVEEGITTMGAEFIGNAVLAGGRTVAETYSHQLAMMARNGTLPTLALPGAQYEGRCACLVGAIARLRHVKYDALAGMAPNSHRPIERWFLAIRPGDTPVTSQIARITAGWIEEWLGGRPETTTEAVAH